MFLNADVTDELPYIDFPLHTIIKLTPLAYGCAEERVDFGIDAVSTYIPRPQVSRGFLCLSCDTVYLHPPCLFFMFYYLADVFQYVYDI